MSVNTAHSVRPAAWLIALLLAAGSGLGWSAEVDPAPQPPTDEGAATVEAEAPAPAVEAEAAANDAMADDATAAEPSVADRLLQQIGKGPLLRVVGEELRWGSDERHFIVSDLADAGQAQIATTIGTVGIRIVFLRSDDASLVTSFAQVVDQAAAAGLGDIDGASGLVFDDSILTGRRLRADDQSVLVLPEGVLRQQDPATIDRDAQHHAAQAAVDALIADPALSELPNLQRSSLTTVLRQAVLPPIPLAELEGDEVDPQFARQLIRHGWLERVLDPLPAGVSQVRAAIAELERLAPRRLFSGSGGRLAELADAFGPVGWLLQTDLRTIAGVQPPRPEYHWPSHEQIDQLLTVIALPAGSDPGADPAVLDEAQRVSLYHRRLLLAEWTAAEGFIADETDWRSFFRDRGRGIASQRVDHYLPPHVVLSDYRGDVHRLFTTTGTLTPPNGSVADADRFMQEAAEALPDAAHLDLIGQYLFKYVYDSPASTDPLLVGTRAINGDIHQTAVETIATAAGGRCRGDCDDLSELYQQIAGMQGKTAHIISLPQHAALAWAEDREGKWHTYIMQTGPTLEFTADRLQDSLAAAYQRFDASDTFDPNGLGLLLRFSGENTRSAWRLSYRIFSEPDYAQTMIDVQRDWHYQTYLEGIRKMERLIADGDQDTANYRELAGLFSFTGQYAKAAEYLKMAIDRTEEADSRLYESAEYIGHLLRAGDEDAATEAVLDVLDRQLPALSDELGGERSMQFGMQLASTLVAEEQFDLAHQVLAKTVDPLAEKLLVGLRQFVENSYDERAWHNQGALRLSRRLLRFAMSIAESELLQRGPAALLDDPAYAASVDRLQRYQQHLAMYEDDEPWQTVGTYGQLGLTYGTLLGYDHFDALLAEAQLPPETDTVDHHRRRSGIAQLPFDLPWIRIAPQYPIGRISLLRDEEGPLDRELIEQLRGDLIAAAAECGARGLESPFLYDAIHAGELIAALLLEDAEALTHLLGEVAERNDKRLRDRTASTLGEWAKHCSMDWWQQVLDIWVQEVDYKPKYYLIAWQAKLNDAPEHALATAALAAERFADDAAFVHEYDFMRQLLTEAENGDTDEPDAVPEKVEPVNEEPLTVP